MRRYDCKRHTGVLCDWFWVQGGVDPKLLTTRIVIRVDNIGPVGDNLLFLTVCDNVGLSPTCVISAVSLQRVLWIRKFCRSNLIFADMQHTWLKSNVLDLNLSARTFDENCKTVIGSCNYLSAL